MLRLDSDKIKDGESGTRHLFVDEKPAEAIRLLRLCRTSAAVKSLIPFIGVNFIIRAKLNGMLLGHEALADVTLREIGLPAVDGILDEVSDGTLDRTKPNWKAARELAVEILGEEGLKARVGFLKLGKNDKVQRFLSGK